MSTTFWGSLGTAVAIGGSKIHKTAEIVRKRAGIMDGPLSITRNSPHNHLSAPTLRG